MSVQRLLRWVFWAAVVSTFVVATLPKPLHVPGEPSDKVQHILGFMVLAILGSAAYARVSALKLVIALAVFGALIEMAQMIPALHRDAELLDWVADVTAVAVVLLAVRAWHYFVRKA
jgi:VanZ family protein